MVLVQTSNLPKFNEDLSTIFQVSAWKSPQMSY